MMDDDRDYEGLHGAPEFGPEAEAQDGGMSLEEARDHLEDLALSYDIGILAPEL